MNLADLYRSSEINRWQIVKTDKQQSVAEHSFNVAMIASILIDELFRGVGVGYQYERQLAIEWALWHDIPEVYTGDMATPIKSYLKEKYNDNDLMGGLEEKLCGNKYTNLKHIIGGTEVVWRIVKLADLMESIKFLDTNTHTRHGRIVLTKLKARMNKFHQECRDVLPLLQWDFVMEKFNELLNGRESCLDDIV